MVELISSALTYFGLILASDIWRLAAADQVAPGTARVFKILAVSLALLVIVVQAGWLARRRHRALRVVLPPALTAGLATLTSVWLVTRRGGRCDDCSLWVIFLVPPIVAAATAALVAFLTAGLVKADGGGAPGRG